MNTVPFPVFSGMWYSTCRESSRRSAWSSFCLSTSAAAYCEANGLQQHKWLQGLGTVITASQPSLPLHPLLTSPHPHCPRFLVCPVAVEQQITDNPVMHAKHMKQALSSLPCVRFQSASPLLLSHQPPLLPICVGSLPSLSL